MSRTPIPNTVFIEGASNFASSLYSKCHATSSLDNHFSLLDDYDDDADEDMALLEENKHHSADSLSRINNDDVINKESVCENEIDVAMDDRQDDIPLVLHADHDAILEEASKWIAEMESVRDSMIWCQVQNAFHADIFAMHNIDSL
jgi:hypothetical protein